MAVVTLNSLETNEFGATESPVRGSLDRGGTGHEDAHQRVQAGRMGLRGYVALARVVGHRHMQHGVLIHGVDLVRPNVFIASEPPTADNVLERPGLQLVEARLQLEQMANYVVNGGE